jgi:CheY-like chemotaxis protein
MGNNTTSLSGLRVLVVEDEPVLSLFFDELLEAEGCQVCGRAANVAAALDLVDHAAPDGVVLDLNLNGEPSLPVADLLTERHVPFVIVSGYSRAEISEPSLLAAPFLEKPFRADALVRALTDAVRQSGTASGLRERHTAFAGTALSAR